MNICKKCFHFVNPVGSNLDDQYARCGRIWEVSLVTGEKVKWEVLPYCRVERHGTGDCGPVGAHYSPVDKLEIIAAMEDTHE